MTVIKNTNEKFIMRLDANDSLANAIRRSVVEIPILAIDEIEVFKNDSALYDEILAHRFGLIPLKTEKNMNEKTKIELKLVKKGPCTVYAEDLEGDAEPVEGKIPLTILAAEHKLEVVATANLGKGIEHAKYIPGLCYYKHLLEVNSSQKIDSIIEKSDGMMKPEKKGSKWICDINDAEIEEINKIEKNAVKDSSEMLLIIESFGNLPAKDILIRAIEVLNDNLDEFEKNID